MSDSIEKALLYTNPLYGAYRLGKSGVEAAGDQIGSVAGHVQHGQQEIAANDRYTDKEKQASRDAYASGEHGLGTEILSQGWSDVKHNVSDALTGLKTAGNLAGDVMFGPTRFALNTLGHFFTDK
jgi:hypothetical protein